MFKVGDSYCLYIETLNGEEEVLIGEKDPMRVHRIISSKSFLKRVSKFGNSFYITKNGKRISFPIFEKFCLELWFKSKEID